MPMSHMMNIYENGIKLLIELGEEAYIFSQMVKYSFDV